METRMISYFAQTSARGKRFVVLGPKFSQSVFGTSTALPLEGMSLL
jgi:hypothetical protein